MFKEWAAFIGMLGAGVVVSHLIMYGLMGRWLSHEKVLQKSLEELGVPETEWDKYKKDLLGTEFHGFLGGIEIVLYATSIAYNKPEFIAVWFATKYVASWSSWDKTPIGRTFYNRALFGSGVNIVLGVITGWLILSFAPLPIRQNGLNCTPTILQNIRF